MEQDSQKHGLGNITFSCMVPELDKNKKKECLERFWRSTSGETKEMKGKKTRDELCKSKNIINELISIYSHSFKINMYTKLFYTY